MGACQSGRARQTGPKLLHCIVWLPTHLADCSVFGQLSRIRLDAPLAGAAVADFEGGAPLGESSAGGRVALAGVGQALEPPRARLSGAALHGN